MPKSGYRFDCSRQPQRFGALLRKEKDEASPSNCFLAGFMNAFILRFVEWRFFVLPVKGAKSLSSTLVSQPKPFRIYLRRKLKDQS